MSVEKNVTAMSDAPQAGQVTVKTAASVKDPIVAEIMKSEMSANGSVKSAGMSQGMMANPGTSTHHNTNANPALAQMGIDDGVYYTVFTLVFIFFFFSVTVGVVLGVKRVFLRRRQVKMMKKYGQKKNFEILTFDAKGFPRLIRYEDEDLKTGKKKTVTKFI